MAEIQGCALPFGAAVGRVLSLAPEMPPKLFNLPTSGKKNSQQKCHYKQWLCMPRFSLPPCSRELMHGFAENFSQFQRENVQEKTQSAMLLRRALSSIYHNFPFVGTLSFSR
jgi:hypothetical protein